VSVDQFDFQIFGKTTQGHEDFDWRTTIISRTSASLSFFVDNEKSISFEVHPIEIYMNNTINNDQM
jgi:hypothetical protein